MKFSTLRDRLQKNQGFTIVEAIVAISIFLIVIAMAVGLFTDSFANKRKTELSRLLYEESRVVLERIVKEVRRGTIDYEEYWNRFTYMSGEVSNQAYGLKYGDYARQFYRDSDNSDGNGTNAVPASIDSVSRHDENIGENYDSSTPPLRNPNNLEVCQSDYIPNASSFDTSGYEQCELYLITATGDEKIIIKLQKDDFGDADASNDEHRLAMLRLPGVDSGTDGQVDTWAIYNGGAYVSDSRFYDFCDEYYDAGHTSAYKCQDDKIVFQEIQPDSINITSLKFFIAPLEDPHKDFAVRTDDVQQQPHVTIQMTAEPSVPYTRGIRGTVPTVTLQTTVSARALNEVKSLNP